MIIVGDRKDSQTYVRMKRRMCSEVGFVSFDKDMPGDASQEEVLRAVKAFNEDPAVHGEQHGGIGLIVPLGESESLMSAGDKTSPDMLSERKRLMWFGGGLVAFHKGSSGDVF